VFKWMTGCMQMMDGECERPGKTAKAPLNRSFIRRTNLRRERRQVNDDDHDANGEPVSGSCLLAIGNSSNQVQGKRC
jgi:hypothetical protein